MFCKNCGKQIDDSSKFCAFCGAGVEHTAHEQAHNSYYKESYKKRTEKHCKCCNILSKNSFLKGISFALIVLFGFLGLSFLQNNFLDDIFSIDKMKYEQYIENPSLIPELTQPKTVQGLVDNLQDVQKFLALYLKASDDDRETKLETFDKYRKEILKLQNFNNSNFLQDNVKYQVPATEKEFKAVKKQYDKILSKVGLTISAYDGYSKYRLEEDSRFTYKKYAKFLPSDIAEYLKLRAKHYQPCISGDSLLIKPYKLAQRIGDYEKFMNSNQEFRYINEVKDLVFTYSFIYAFTSDRTDMKYLNNKAFTKSDKKFLKNYPSTQLQEIFSHLISSANGISEKQFDEMYPYEYQKNLDDIKPEKSDLNDIFTLVRKNIMQVKTDANYQYIYVAESSKWIPYDASKPLKKGDIIIAQSEGGYDVYDYKYKKTNQTIKPDSEMKFFIKMDQLFAYFPSRLQICSLESMYGSFSFKALPIKAIKKLFPDTLIINIDTFGDSSVQIDKPSGAKTYILISSSGMNYEGYRLSGNITLGELPNIFTVTSDADTQVTWASDSLNGEAYHIYFITQSAQQPDEEAF